MKKGSRPRTSDLCPYQQNYCIEIFLLLPSSFAYFIHIALFLQDYYILLLNYL